MHHYSIKSFLLAALVALLLIALVDAQPVQRLDSHQDGQSNWWSDALRLSPRGPRLSIGSFRKEPHKATTPEVATTPHVKSAATDSLVDHIANVKALIVPAAPQLKQHPAHSKALVHDSRKDRHPVTSSPTVPKHATSTVKSASSSTGAVPIPTDKCSPGICNVLTGCNVGAKRAVGPFQTPPDSTDLQKRAFASLSKNGEVRALSDKTTTNLDLSEIDDSGLLDGTIRFARVAKSATITQLNGCTGVFLVSPNGLYGAHILEFDSFKSNNDLSHEGFQTHMQTVAASMRRKARPFLQGAQLHILLPTKDDGGITYDKLQSSKPLLQETMRKLKTRSAAKAEDHIPDKDKRAVPISATIINQLEAAAGGLKATIHTYTVQDRSSRRITDANSGTFVAQFDPENLDDQGKAGPAVRLSVNGQTVVSRIAL